MVVREDSDIPSVPSTTFKLMCGFVPTLRNGQMTRLTLKGKIESRQASCRGLTGDETKGTFGAIDDNRARRQWRPEEYWRALKMPGELLLAGNGHDVGIVRLVEGDWR